MIFAVEIEEQTLIAFADQGAAVAHCEGLDVEAAVWLFWDDRGEPLEPRFSVPNKRGFFVSCNGTYSLVPASPNHHAHLSEAVDEVKSFESAAPFDSAQGIRAYLERGNELRLVSPQAAQAFVEEDAFLDKFRADCSATIRRLHPADASALIALRLEVAAVNEVAMGASLAEERARSIESFKNQLAPEAPGAIFGCFIDSQLVAAAGIHRPNSLPSSAHKAALWGVVVSPSRWREGLGRVVVERAIAHAFCVGVRRINLIVYLPNEAAVRLYESLGFRTYGIEPQALCIEGHFCDAQLMTKTRDGA